MTGWAAVSIVADRAITLVTQWPNTGVALWFLAAVFMIAGFAKMRRPGLAAIVDFGVLRRVHPRFGFAVGAIEVILSASLAMSTLFAPVVRSATVAASIFLWGFSILILRAIVAGERFPCFCFGETESDLSFRTFLRTLVLAILATVLAIRIPNEAGWTGLSTLGKQSVAGISVIALAYLLLQIPDLVHWNRDPLVIRTDGHR